MPEELKPREWAFVREYVVDLNASRAAEAAGYKRGEQGKALLKRPRVKEAIERAKKERERRLAINADRVVQEIAKLAFSDMAHYVKLDGRGTAYLDFDNMPEGATAAISEVNQEEYIDGSGDDERMVKKTRFKLHDKLKALDMLGRHLSLYQEHQEAGAGRVNVAVVDTTRLIEDENLRRKAAELYDQLTADDPGDDPA